MPDTTVSSDQNGLITPWRIGLLAVLATSVLLYLPALRGVPIWDDTLLMAGVKAGTKSVTSAFTEPFGNYFRPLTAASFAIENSLVHGQPLLYHTTNLVLHALASLTVAWLGLLLTGRRSVGILAGLFFAAQPMQVGAAAWIGGRTDTLSGLFLGLFLVALVRYHQSSRVHWLIASVAAYFLAALSKEQAAAILPAVPLSVYVFGSGKHRDAWRLSGPFVGALLIYAGLWAIGAPLPHRGSDGLSETIMLALRTAGHYGIAFLIPNKPSLIEFTLENGQGALWLPLGAAIILGVAVLIRETWKSNRTIGWLALCGVLVYIPISNCPTAPSLVVAPYRCAEAGVAVATLFGIAAAAALESKHYVWAGALGANLVVGASVTWWGVHQWMNPADFFKVVNDNDPHFIIAALSEAHYLEDEQKHDEAARVCDRTLQWVFASAEWPQLLQRRGLNAITPSLMTRLRSNVGIPHVSGLGSLIATEALSLAQSGQEDQAAILAGDALLFTPKDPWLNFLYGRLVLRTDRADALRHWELALKLDPNYAELALALGHQRLIDRRYREARDLLRSATKLAPDDGYGWLDLARAEAGDGNIGAANDALNHARTAHIRPTIQQFAKATAEIADHRG